MDLVADLPMTKPDTGTARATFTAPSPLGRLIDPDHVARACTFLSSDAAASITGEDLNVNAGVAMY